MKRTIFIAEDEEKMRRILEEKTLGTLIQNFGDVDSYGALHLT